MTQEEATRILKSSIQVTPQHVVVAKGHIVNNFNPRTHAVVQSVLESVEARPDGELVVHLTLNTEESIKSVAETLSWVLASCEAIWGLISSGIVLPASSDLRDLMPPVSYSTIVQGSGGRGGLNLGDLAVKVPGSLILAPSVSMGGTPTLADPDLYLHRLEIPDIDKEVEEALRESVRCFKHELYLACLTMLGRASEGAWIELGLALCGVAASATNTDKTKAKLEDSFVGIGKKILETAKLYERADVFGTLHKRSGVRPQDLNNAVLYADTIRDSRNSIHYGANAALPNSYEKVAALLMGAVPHLRLLYNIRAAVK